MGSHARFHASGGHGPNRMASSFDGVNLPFGKICCKCGNPISSEIHSPLGDVPRPGDRKFPCVCFMLFPEPAMARRQVDRDGASPYLAATWRATWLEHY